MAIVINLDESEQTVELRVRGLGECVVAAPDLHDEYPLRRYYERPSGANAAAFVNDLFALSVSPARRPAEFAVLPEAHRARLRRAVAVAAGCRKQWRRLHGCHLSGDERLLSVMFWRWQRWERLRARLRERLLENQKAAANSVDFALGEPGATRPTMSLVDVATYGDQVSRERLATAAELARSFPGTQELVRSLVRQFDTRVQVSDFLRSMSSLTRLSHVMKLTQSPLLSVRPELFTVNVPKFSDFRLLDIMRASMAVSHWTSTVETMKRWDQMLGAGSLTATALTLARLKLPEFPRLPSVSSFVRQVEEMCELQTAMDAVERFERRWQSRTFAYLVLGLLTCCSVWELAKLALLSDDEVEEVVLRAVEAVVRDGEFVPAMRGELKRTTLLSNERTRRQLDHMLEHAGRGEWPHASDPLYAGGLEGAFWTAGAAENVTTPGRTFRGQKKIMSFKTLIKQLPMPQELKTLMNTAVFGGVGHTYRHGEADEGERRQVLLGIAALAGLFEHFDNRPAFTVFIRRAADALPEALEVPRVDSDPTIREANITALGKARAVRRATRHTARVDADPARRVARQAPEEQEVTNVHRPRTERAHRRLD